MAKNPDLWYDPIDKNTDWGGDSSTGGKPVAGEEVQRFLKSELSKRVGVFYLERSKMMYLGFSDEQSKALYLSDPESYSNLILCELPASSDYQVKLFIEGDQYNAVALGQTGNSIKLSFDVIDEDDNSYPDSINYVITIQRNAMKYEIPGTLGYGKSTSIDIDQYLTVEGQYDIVIQATSLATSARGSASLVYQVVQLDLTTNYDMTKVFDLDQPLVPDLEVSYTVFGTSERKYLEWYLDGELYKEDVFIGGIASPDGATERIPVSHLSHGIHNFRLRAYVIVNYEKFYTDVVYGEFLVIADQSDKSALPLIRCIIPKDVEDVLTLDPIKLFGLKQYNPYTLQYMVFNPTSVQYTELSIVIDDVEKQKVNAITQTELAYTYIPYVSGSQTLKLITPNYERVIELNIQETAIDIEPIDKNLVLSLSSIGRSNDDSNRESWTYGEYSTIFKGFTWNSHSGWYGDRLILGENSSIEINYSPLLDIHIGKSIELEFETTNVIKDDVVLCDITNEEGFGLVITASEVRLKLGDHEEDMVSTKFKSNENIRVSFVIDNGLQLAFIYVNGYNSGAIRFIDETFSVDKPLNFKGSEFATIKLKQVLVYDTKLSADQILNNHMLYRDTVEEMIKLYEKNNVLSGSEISISKIAEFIPVMKITGNIEYIESQEDKDAQTKADIEYEDTRHPQFNFKIVGGCLRLQGTSSSKYPKKNFRIYTQRKGFPAIVYDYLGEENKSKLIQFKERAIPVDCFCLKADYAESSSTHNTGVARLWNEVLYNAVDNELGYVLRTEAQKCALESGYPYDVRTTVDGFPIVIFGRQTESDDYHFIGKYNFNNDKSTENVFGFCDIPGFDDKIVEATGRTYGDSMQCWEILENGNPYALMLKTEGWNDQAIDSSGNLVFDKGDPVPNWATGFEARYPDDGLEANTSDLFRLVDWLVRCKDNPKSGESGYDPKYDFNATWLEYIHPWLMAAYYVYILRFGAVDQVVKNSMLTSEDALHWYFINYDNDTIAGLKNTGALKFGPDITRQSKDESGAYIYAGHDSTLWNLLEACPEFITYVEKVDNVLFRGGDGLSYDAVMDMFNVKQSDAWCQRIYNKDAEYKYLGPFANQGINNLFMLQGPRKSHRQWWFAKRFKLMDGKFNNTNYTSRSIQLKLDQTTADAVHGMNILVTAGEYMYYGCRSNHTQLTAIELQYDETYQFKDDKKYNVGDVISIYAPQSIKVLDLSKNAKYLDYADFTKLTDPVLGNRLQKLIICSLDENGKPTPSRSVQSFSGLSNAYNLEELDLRGMQIPSSVGSDFKSLGLLRKLYLSGSTISKVELADGCLIDYLQLSESTTDLTLKNLSNLEINSIENFRSQHIKNLNIQGCLDISKEFLYFYNWSKDASKGDSLTLYDIDWPVVSPPDLIEFGKCLDRGTKLDLRGKVTITVATIDQVEELQRLFGSDCFTNNAQFWISAPESVFIHGPKEILSGTSATYTTTVFSENPGRLIWSLYDSDLGRLLSESELQDQDTLRRFHVKSIVSNPDGTGTLTTIEDINSDHIIPLGVTHIPTNSDTYSRWTTTEITSKKTIYSTGGIISGISTIVDVGDTYSFKLTLLPDTIWRGKYRTEWSVTTVEGYEDSVEITKQDNNSCELIYKKLVTFEYRNIVARVTNIDSEGNDLDTIEITLPITVTDENVLLTQVSNPEVMAIVYERGWAADPKVFYRSEAEGVGDIGTTFQRSKIKTFNEFSAFKNLTEIPSQAFAGCRDLTSIEIPENVQKIGTLAFNQVNCNSLAIPAAVTSISYDSFKDSSIREFIVLGGNSFRAQDGVLISASGIIIKYPEQKADEVYQLPSDIVGIGDWSFYNTKLKQLIIPDSVISHGTDCIRSNENLESIYIGAKYALTGFASGFLLNPVLTNIEISEDNELLASDNGIVYDKSFTTLIYHPSGKKEFNIKSVERIGSYACRTGNTTIRLEVAIPNSVRYIDARAFHEGYQVRSIYFNLESKLQEIGEYAFELCQNMVSIELPASLTSIKSYALISTPKLGEIFCYAVVPPKLIIGSDGYANTFGDSTHPYTGRDVSEKVLHVPSSSTDYQSGEWGESLLNPSRNNFKISLDL